MPADPVDERHLDLDVVQLEVVAVEHVGLDPALALALERRVGADADRGRVALAGVEPAQPPGVHPVGGSGDHAAGRARWPSGSRARGRAGRRGPRRRAPRTAGRAPAPRPRRRRRPGRCGRTSTTRPADRRRGGRRPPGSRARAPLAVSVPTSPDGLGAVAEVGADHDDGRVQAVDQHPARELLRASTPRSRGRRAGPARRRRRTRRAATARVSRSVSVVGACSGRSTAIGCGSKVTATTRSPSASASSARLGDRRAGGRGGRRRSCRSRPPYGPRSPGTSSNDRQICTAPRITSARAGTQRRAS